MTLGRGVLRTRVSISGMNHMVTLIGSSGLHLKFSFSPFIRSGDPLAIREKAKGRSNTN
jgi:hypothetical protein